MFHMPEVPSPTYPALANYSVIGALIGVFSALIPRVVYWIEDGFDRLHVHWRWWPALGAIAVGIVGYISPRTLDVGYEHISTDLSGDSTMRLRLFRCFLKIIYWYII